MTRHVPGALGQRNIGQGAGPNRPLYTNGGGVVGEIGFAVCAQCGSSPAVALSFRCRTGAPFNGMNDNREATLCRDCGYAVGRDTTNRDLLWSVFRVNKIKSVKRALHNRAELKKLTRLSSPRAVAGRQVGTPLAPRRRVMFRAGILILVVQVAALAASSVIVYDQIDQRVFAEDTPKASVDPR